MSTWKKHGKSRSAEYKCWDGIVQRCTNNKYHSYSNYGGRGIRLCNRWSKFENFYADMGSKPSENHSIERIDNEQGYEPSNCRWATSTEQARNRRSNHTLTHDGRTQCVQAWAEECGINKVTLLCRIRAGWSVSKAVSTPPRKYRSKT